MTTYSAFRPHPSTTNFLKCLNTPSSNYMEFESALSSSSSDTSDSTCLFEDSRQSERTTTTNVLSLYPEILSHVFQFLDVPERGRVAQVCRYWRDVVYERVIWRGVEAKMHLRKSGNSQLYSSLARRGIFKIQILSLKRSLRELVAGLPGITSLKLSGCYSVTDSTLASAFVMTPPLVDGSMCALLTQLTTLDLSLCKQVSDSSLARIANRAPNLRNLELGGCCQISDAGLLVISWGLRKLQRLNLRSCYLITDAGIGFLTGNVTSSHLQEPRIRDFLRNLGLLETSSPGLSGKLSPDLKIVDRSSTMTIPIVKIRDKSSRIRSSTSMSLDPHSFLPKRHRSDRDMEAVALSRRSSKKCAICQQGVVAVPSSRYQSTPQINCRKNSNSSVEFPTKHHRERADRSSSTTVHFQEYFLDKIRPSSAFGVKGLQFLGLQDCQKLSDRSLSFIGCDGLPALQSINLSFCIHISDAGLRELGKLSSIFEINLRSCDNVTDIGLLNLSDCGGRLKALDVSFCDKIGNSGLGFIAQFMPKLSTLSLSACDISDPGLIRVVSGLGGLETLNLGQCAKITDEAIKIIAEKCTEIKYIDLYGCTKITKEGLDFILKMPSIKSLNLGLWHCR